MNIHQQFAEMVGSYDKLAAQLMPAAQPVTPEADPAKYQWAKQEGYEPHFDPNSNQVTWIQKPKPSYDVPELLKFRGSMSPETMAENYPMFGLKADRLDPLLTEIYKKVLDGEISQQRGEELCFQLMKNTFKEAKKLGKPKGAGVKSSSIEQTISKAMKGHSIVDTKK